MHGLLDPPSFQSCSPLSCLDRYHLPEVSPAAEKAYTEHATMQKGPHQLDKEVWKWLTAQRNGPMQAVDRQAEVEGSEGQAGHVG